MNFHRTEPDPAAVRRALQMAAHLPTRANQRLRVQVVDWQGSLLAAGILESDEQVAFLRDMLRTVGTFDLVPAPLAARHGCDVLLRDAHASRPADLVKPPPGSWGGGRDGDFSAFRAPAGTTPA